MKANVSRPNSNPNLDSEIIFPNCSKFSFVSFNVSHDFNSRLYNAMNMIAMRNRFIGKTKDGIPHSLVECNVVFKKTLDTEPVEHIQRGLHIRWLQSPTCTCIS